jgi:NitT/TauT family transport system ATP-binding protein
MGSSQAGAPLRVDHVTKRYGAGRQRRLVAVDDLTFEVPAGEFAVLLGPSGCGKSTLLKMIAGLIPPSQGTIWIGDRLVTKPGDDAGMMFQSPVLLPWRSVLRNVLLPIHVSGKPVKAYRERAEGLLHSVGLGGWENHLPNELSGGMQQRVAICRALIQDPPMLLLDEPFGALDSMTREVLNDLLASICSAAMKTTVLVTHDVSEAVYLADRVIVMSPRPGRVVADVDVPFERPRSVATRLDPAFEALAVELRSCLQLRVADSGDGLADQLH